MGSSCSKRISPSGGDALQASRAIERAQRRARRSDGKVKKLLLLGAGESGKSTLFKQLKNMYGKPYSKADRAHFLPAIVSNIISSMQTLVEESDNLSSVFPDCKTADEVNGLKKEIAKIEDDTVITPELAIKINNLWNDGGIKTTYERRALFQLLDTCPYFFEKAEEIAAAKYVPSMEDVVKCRVRTTGIIETFFGIRGVDFNIIDVGGQRNQRKKWIHSFEEVTGIVFVAALSEYDQVLYEDGSTNRMIEALDLFEHVCNLGWFSHTPMILVLNKRDLLAEKIKTVHITKCFPDYYGPQEYDDVVEYISTMFDSQNLNPDREVYTHVTCATDPDNVAHVFTASKDIVIRSSMNEGGFL
jgi:GTPase SAR1 family protein